METLHVGKEEEVVEEEGEEVEREGRKKREEKAEHKSSVNESSLIQTAQ